MNCDKKHKFNSTDSNDNKLYYKNNGCTVKLENDLKHVPFKKRIKTINSNDKIVPLKPLFFNNESSTPLKPLFITQEEPERPLFNSENMELFRPWVHKDTKTTNFYQEPNHESKPIKSYTTNLNNHKIKIARNKETTDLKMIKNMTKEKRLEANARERKRVQTITDSYMKLGRLLPTYSQNQKLSKLAILRISTSYIKLLIEMSNSSQHQETINSCIDNVIEMMEKENNENMNTY